MSKVLIIHHLESCWEASYKKYGTSFYELSRKIITHIKRSNYDRVILTRFEDNKPEDCHYESEIVDFVNHWYEYSYGWDKEGYEAEETDSTGEYLDPYDNLYCEGGNHSEIVLIADWMQELKYDNVSICGAFDGECIEDLEIALRFVGCNFRRLDKLIV